jgi:hypothetical protein
MQAVTAPDTFEVESSHASNTSHMAKRVVLPESMKLVGVMNELRNAGAGATSYCKIRFEYDDNTTQFSSQPNTSSDTYQPQWYENPSQTKPVRAISTWLYTSTGNASYPAVERRTSILRVPGEIDSYITFDLPQYEENATHFKVKVDATREAGDQIWFAILDGNATKTYAEADFEQYHAVAAPIGRPRRLRIYMRPKAGTASPATAVSAVYWTTNDPKSFYSGQDRIYRGEHFDEAVREVRSRRQVVPSNADAKRGFRLVQRSN